MLNRRKKKNPPRAAHLSASLATQLSAICQREPTIRKLFISDAIWDSSGTPAWYVALGLSDPGQLERLAGEILAVIANDPGARRPFVSLATDSLEERLAGSEFFRRE